MIPCRGSVAALFVLTLLILTACSTSGPARPYFDADAYAHYYETESGRILRVERDGAVLDVTCLHPPVVKGAPREDVLQQLCPDGRVEKLGTVSRRADGQWDMTGYLVAPETGTCTSLFAPFRNEWLEDKRESCWHRVWEVPAALIVYPSIAVLAIGLITAPVWVPLLLL